MQGNIATTISQFPGTTAGFSKQSPYKKSVSRKRKSDYCKKKLQIEAKNQ